VATAMVQVARMTVSAQFPDSS